MPPESSRSFVPIPAIQPRAHQSGCPSPCAHRLPSTSSLLLLLLLRSLSLWCAHSIRIYVYNMCTRIPERESGRCCDRERFKTQAKARARQRHNYTISLSRIACLPPVGLLDRSAHRLFFFVLVSFTPYV